MAAVAAVAVCDSSIIRRLLDQEIVIFCYHTVTEEEVSRLITTTMTTAQSPCSLHMERGISNTTSRIFLYEYHRNSGLHGVDTTTLTFIVDFLMRLVVEQANLLRDVLTVLRGRQLYRSLLQGALGYFDLTMG